MKALLLGLGQNTIILSKIMTKNNIEHYIVARRSSGVIAKLTASGIETQKVIFLSEIIGTKLLEIYSRYQFTHIFNFAANSFVQDSAFNFSYFIQNNSFLLFELLNVCKKIPDLWLFHPLSSEILHSSSRQQESMSLQLGPRNAYGLSKTLEYHTCRMMHEQHAMNINYCVMFNHESQFRSQQFFSKKVINFLTNLNPKQTNQLEIYNCSSMRDWGSAYEYMNLIYGSANRKRCGETMLGTSHLMTVEDFIDLCLIELNLDTQKTVSDGLLTWRGPSFMISEKARNNEDAQRILKADPERVFASFSTNPEVYGKKLIQELLNE
jgi:GDPmannose 4,6-dehydratase